MSTRIIESLLTQPTTIKRSFAHHIDQQTSATPSPSLSSSSPLNNSESVALRNPFNLNDQFVQPPQTKLPNNFNQQYNNGYTSIEPENSPNNLIDNLASTNDSFNTFYPSTSTALNINNKTSNELSVPQPQSFVPRCSICNAESTGIHFGAEACSAWQVKNFGKFNDLIDFSAAYFRRTVVLKRTYSCPRNNNCNIELDSKNRKKCKSCRFAKCISMGMDSSAVQGRRDAIGKFSLAFKRDTNTDSDLMENVQSPAPQSNETSCDAESPSTSGEHIGSTMKELRLRYGELNKLRKIFYCQNSIYKLVDETDELEPTELNDFSECMFQLWRLEPRLCIKFITDNIYLKELPASEKTRLFSNFLLSFHAVEEPYLTFKHGGLCEDNRFWMMPNRVYMKFSKAEQYFDIVPNMVNSLNLDKKSAINLFKPSFEQSMETIGEKMALLNIDDIEFYCLVGLVLFDPTCKNISTETRLHLAKFRSLIFNELLQYYRYNEVVEPEVRLGNLIVMILQGVKIHAMKYRENIQLMQFFKIVPMSGLFSEILSMTAP